MLREARLKYSEDLYLSPSFPAIVGSGPNGAIIHYRPTLENHAIVTDFETPILIDTGGQYFDGTTDTTRTLVFDGEKVENNEKFKGIKEMYTRVLMGNLDL